ncbi:MAG TPA: hypothetical protein VHK69_02720, partial [Chitinophagaceae bacterium]|nr:hypothetical protein [Chitinophagaceae bacterium]
RTVFSLGIHSKEGEQNFVVFDYLSLENTYELLPGAYPYSKEFSSQNFQAGRFHDVVLKCNSPVMSGAAYEVKDGVLRISKVNGNYEVNANFIMDGKKYKVHFKGPIQHIKSW